MTRLLDSVIDVTEMFQNIRMDIGGFLQTAVEDIDEIFGKGFAKSHPELVSGYIQSCAIEHLTEMTLHGFEAIAQEIRAAKETTIG